MVGLVREVFPVVWLVRRQPRAPQGSGRSRSRSAAKRGHVLDQTHEHDLAGGGLPVLW